jgi:hypothetical protein
LLSNARTLVEYWGFSGRDVLLIRLSARVVMDRRYKLSSICNDH